jgi:hypothetical protein
MAMRKLQLYITEEQYQLLKQRAGERRSLAEVVRELIDERVGDAQSDPFYRYLLAPKKGSGKPYRADAAKRELYRQPQ